LYINGASYDGTTIATAPHALMANGAYHFDL
jgi:hypothetical protein